jgi:CRP/FNR family transcriptional regulator, cyclic AMP receptor protein
MLRGVPLFASCSDRELAQVDGLVDELTIQKGAVLTKEGTPARQAFVIVSGHADVSVDGTRIAKLAPGHSFGEMALLSRQVGVRSATVTATSELRLLVLDPRNFNSLVDMPCIAKKMLGELSDRLRETDEVAVQKR